MSTISVTVMQPNQAFMLAEWLKNIRFVQDVSIDIDEPASGNAKKIKSVLDSIKSKQLFANIMDPVAYQRELRDEWER
jgi:hypothetical protein